MATPHKATPKQWKELEDRATDREFFFISACVAELRSRIEALEANQPHQQDKLDRLIALDRSDPAPAPAGGLMQAVGAAICSVADCGDTPLNWAPEARAAILAVAEWFDGIGYGATASILRQEVQRHG